MTRFSSKRLLFLRSRIHRILAYLEAQVPFKLLCYFGSERYDLVLVQDAGCPPVHVDEFVGSEYEIGGVDEAVIFLHGYEMLHLDPRVFLEDIAQCFIPFLLSLHVERILVLDGDIVASRPYAAVGHRIEIIPVIHVVLAAHDPSQRRWLESDYRFADGRIDEIRIEILADIVGECEFSASRAGYPPVSSATE